MSERVQTQVKARSAPSFAPVRSGLLQRKAANEAEPSSVPPIVHEVLSSPGQPLDSETRTFMEPRFGHDFSRVRVHTDAKAAESARAVNAMAYTVGRDVVFGAGQYAPWTFNGRQLIAHELVHTLQQSHVCGLNAQRLSVAPDSDPLELNAEHISQRMMLSHSYSLQTASDESRAKIAPVRYLYRKSPTGGPGGGLLPLRRIVYIDANVIDQINRGNQAAAAALQQLRTSGADLRLSKWAYLELVGKPEIPRTATANRLMIEELNLRVDPAVPFSQRVDIGLANEKLKGGTVISPQDAQIAIGAKAGGGEIWSFDRAFRNNPQNIQATFGVSVAAESNLPLVKSGSIADYRVGRRLMNLQPVEISLSGVVSRGGGAPGGGPSAPTGSGIGARRVGLSGVGPETEPSSGSAGSTSRVNTSPIASPIAPVAPRIPHPASPSLVIERTRLIFELERQTLKNAEFTKRLRIYTKLAGAWFKTLEMLKTVDDVLSIANDGTVLPNAQRTADRIEEQANQARIQAQTTYDSISLLAATEQINDAISRDDSKVLFEISKALGDFAIEIHEQALKYEELARGLKARSYALDKLSSVYSKVMQIPQGETTAPQASAFAMYISLQRLSGTLSDAATKYGEAHNELRFLADSVLSLASRANHTAWQQALNEIARRLAEIERERAQPSQSQ